MSRVINIDYNRLYLLRCPPTVSLPPICPSPRLPFTSLSPRWPLLICFASLLVRRSPSGLCRLTAYLAARPLIFDAFPRYIRISPIGSDRNYRCLVILYRRSRCPPDGLLFPRALEARSLSLSADSLARAGLPPAFLYACLSSSLDTRRVRVFVWYRRSAFVARRDDYSGERVD